MVIDHSLLVGPERHRAIDKLRRRRPFARPFCLIMTFAIPIFAVVNALHRRFCGVLAVGSLVIAMSGIFALY